MIYTSGSVGQLKDWAKERRFVTDNWNLSFVSPGWPFKNDNVPRYLRYRSRFEPIFHISAIRSKSIISNISERWLTLLLHQGSYVILVEKVVHG